MTMIYSFLMNFLEPQLEEFIVECHMEELDL